MAIVLKAGHTFTPSTSAKMGVDLTSDVYYGVIDEVRYHKGIKKCLFVVEIYGSKELRANGGIVVDKIQFGFEDSSTPADGNPISTFTDSIGLGGLSVPQAYAKALETLTDWESDEA